MRFPLLFDDAALFPPGNLSLAEAILAHQAHRQAPYADLVGPLVVPPGVLTDEEVAVVVPDAATAAHVLALDGPRVVALEVTDGTGLHSAVGDPAGVAVFVEVPRGERRDAVIAGLAVTSYAAKIRTGGLRAGLFPDEAELASTVVALTRAGVPFKATAGLHHALRHHDPQTGFEHHGFLNLLAASHCTDVAEATALLGERDPRALPAPRASLLRSIGTCSITDPIDDLTALGLLPEVVR